MKFYGILGRLQEVVGGEGVGEDRRVVGREKESLRLQTAKRRVENITEEVFRLFGTIPVQPQIGPHTMAHARVGR